MVESSAEQGHRQDDHDRFILQSLQLPYFARPLPSNPLTPVSQHTHALRDRSILCSSSLYRFACTGFLV